MKKYYVNIKSIKMEWINLVSMTDFTTTKKSEVEVKVLTHEGPFYLLAGLYGLAGPCTVSKWGTQAKKDKKKSHQDTHRRKCKMSKK